MKQYSKPMLDKIKLDIADVLMASGGLVVDPGEGSATDDPIIFSGGDPVDIFGEK